MSKKRVQKNKKEDTATSLKDKVNSDGKTSFKPKKDDRLKSAKNKINNSKKSNFFFWQLSKVSQFTLCLLIVFVLVFGFLFAKSLMRQGDPQIGSRQKPAVELTDDNIAKIKSSIESNVSNLDSVDISYIGFRLVVVMDLKDSASASDAKSANYKAYKEINKITPIKKYFFSKDKLNNDLYIYSTDVVPKDYDTNSKFIYETYKNSNMTSAKTHDLLKARDKKSKQEVLETMEKAKKDGN